MGGAIRPESSQLLCSSLTMLPTLPFTLDARSLWPALPGQGTTAHRIARLAPGESTRSTRLARCYQLDSSAEAQVAASARSRAFVHVAYTSVFCPDGYRREPASSSESCWRQRPWRPTSNCESANHAPRRATLPRCAAGFRPALVRWSASCASLSTVAEPTLAGGHDGWLRPAAPEDRCQGGPSNHERKRVHEKRNVGECLAARGVPNCHH
ncbi:hypothetical protein ETAA8_05500 [Anatilimnocola aggregata]|uniref:Uncharacterized protein n=1 Tax=Anatilimnocola aggregata TaxID=2528021 RepID=A0A517Y5T1_9BACT|nr:hypothetical protein ETAA8_05500 [Anatilimnocola aggregata]